MQNLILAEYGHVQLSFIYTKVVTHTPPYEPHPQIGQPYFPALLVASVTPQE